MVGVLRPASGRRRSGAGRRGAAATGEAGGGRRAGRVRVGHHGLHQHHLGGGRAGLPRRRGHREELPSADPLECGGDGAAGSAPRDRRRRAHLDVRRRGHLVRGRPEPLLPRARPSGRRGPGVLPGPRLAGHVRAGVPRGAAERGGPGRLPAGAVQGAARPAVVPAPAVDARVLAVPDGVDGDRPDERDLPGAVQPVPAGPGHQGHLRPARLGVPRRRRDG